MSLIPCLDEVCGEEKATCGCCSHRGNDQVPKGLHVWEANDKCKLEGVHEGVDPVLDTVDLATKLFRHPLLHDLSDAQV